MKLIKTNGERDWSCRSAPRTICIPRLHAYMPSSQENEVALYPNNYQLHTREPTRQANTLRRQRGAQKSEEKVPTAAVSSCARKPNNAPKHERTSETCLSGRDVNGVPNKPKKAREENKRRRSANASLCSFREELSAVSRRRSDSRAFVALHRAAKDKHKSSYDW